jgi:hypothetical protein
MHAERCAAVVIHSRIPIGIHVLASYTEGTAHFVRSALGINYGFAPLGALLATSSEKFA